MAYEFARKRYDGGWLGWYTFPDGSSETRTGINGSTSNPQRMLLRIKGTATSDNRATAQLTLNFTYITNYESPTLTYYVYTSLPNLDGYAVPSGYVSHDTITLKNTSNNYAKTSFTTNKFSIGQSVNNIYIFFRANSGMVLTDYNGKSNSNYAWSASLVTKSYAYTACTAPTSIRVKVDDGKRNIIKPQDKLTISWSGAKAGSNNAISHYKVAIRFGAEPTLTTNNYLSSNISSSSNSITINLNLANGTYTRGDYLRVKVYVYGKNYNPTTIPSKLIVFNNDTNGKKYLNRLPTAPSITGSTIIPSTSSIIKTLVPSSTDNDGQDITYYYSIGNIPSDRRKYDQTIGIDIGATTTDIYFCAFDGLEYSNSTKITVTKNILPTATISYNYTPFLVNGISYVDYITLQLQTNKSCSLNIQIDFLSEDKILGSYNYINKTIGQQKIEETINLQKVLPKDMNVYNKLQTNLIYWRVKTTVKDNLEEKSEYFYPSSSSWFSTPQFPTNPLLFNELNEEILVNGTLCVGNNVKIQFIKNPQFLTEDQDIGIFLYNNSDTSKAQAELNGIMSSDNNNMYITANIPQGSLDLHGLYTMKFQLKGSNYQDLTVEFNKNIFIVEQPKIGTFSYAPGASGTNTVYIKPFTDKKVYFTVGKNDSFDSLSSNESGNVWQKGIIQYSINGNNWFDQITDITFNTGNNNLYNAYIDIEKAYSFGHSLSIPNYSKTYQRYARLKLVNIFGQEFYSNSVPFILNFEESVEQISCDSLQLIKDNESKAFNINTNKLQQGTNFKFDIKYKGYTEREMDFYLYAKVGTEVVAKEQKITPTRTLFLVETDTPVGARTQREETISLTYTNLPQITLNDNWTWYIKAVPKGQQTTAEDETEIKINSSANLITQVAPQTNPNSKITACEISNNQVILTGENLDSSNAIKFSLLEEGNIVVDNAGSHNANTIIFNKPSSWTADLSGKKIQLLIIDQPKSGTNGILFDGIAQNYYSNEFIIYSDQPTIAYRPNHLGINTKSPDDIDCIIDIRPTSKYKKVRLYDGSTNGNVIELDLSKAYDDNNTYPAIIVKRGSTEYTLFFD